MKLACYEQTGFQAPATRLHTYARAIGVWLEMGDSGTFRGRAIAQHCTSS